jgi:IS4 transposase
MYRTDEEEYVLVLLTDLVDLDVSLIALLYLYRWTIELFFRWLKSILKIGHLVANSQNGVTIMVY